jgi:hypothetical protein
VNRQQCQFESKKRSVRNGHLDHDLRKLTDLQEIAIMTSFLSLQAAARARGDGLRPELLALVTGTDSGSVPRHDGMIQSGPDPKPRAADKPADVSPLARGADHLSEVTR